MSTLTAKHFQEPLLRALGDLTGFKAGKAVRGEDTYAPVMALMGITGIDVHGTEASSGQPMVQRWIQWACKNLRKTGQVDLEGRGSWVLTAKGVAEAQVLVKGTVVVVAPAVVVVAPAVVPAAGVPTQDPIVVKDPSRARAMAPYLKDPYILHLVLEQTPCLGHYTSHKGAECASCPVTVECQNKQHVAFSQAAAKLAAVDAKAAAAVKPGTSTPVTAPAASTPVAASVKPKAKFDIKAAQKITAFQEVFCVVCGNAIPQNSQCYWVDDIQTGESRMLHLTCGDVL